MTKKAKTAKKAKTLFCSICLDPIQRNPLTGWDQGHNAQPINDGRCCDVCNDTQVIPTRIRQIYNVLEK